MPTTDELRDPPNCVSGGESDEAVLSMMFGGDDRKLLGVPSKKETSKS
jgi:hypothetical protein